MITQIGVISGEILNLLENVQNHEASVKQLEFLVEKPRDLVLMAIGLLIYSGLIHGEMKDDELYVWLLKKDEKVQREYHCREGFCALKSIKGGGQDVYQ